MSGFQKLFGRFAYQADVIPKGGRTSRRIDLWAPAEFEIATVAADQIQPDAFVIEPLFDDTGFERGKPLALSAYDGALWSPMKPIRYLCSVKAIAHLCPISAEEYADQSIGRYEQSFVSDDPIRAAYNSALSPDGAALPLPETQREDDFDGKIIWSNRADALARHVEAARDVLFVGDAVYARRPEPTWTVVHQASWGHTEIGLTGLVSSASSQRFRIDRLADAIEWQRAQHPRISHRVKGNLVRADFSLARRNDLACMMRDLAPAILHGSITTALPFLSDHGVTAWRDLVAATRTAPVRTFLDDRVGLPAMHMAERLSALVSELSVPTIPTLHNKAVKDALAKLLPLRARAEFEITRQPATAMTTVEDEAISRLGERP